MKKIIAFLTAIILILNINTGYCAAISTYDNLLMIEDEFIGRVKNGGVNDSQVKAFIDDIDLFIGEFKEDIYISELDLYFISIFLQVMSKEEHIPIMIAFDIMYQEEIKYMTEYKKVPANMRNFMLIAFGDKIIIETPKIKDEDNNDNNDNTNQNDNENEYIEPIELPFSDIEIVPWCIDSIVELYENNIISGTGDDKFEPERFITREEFIKIVVLTLLDINEMYVREFGKRASEKWFNQYIAAADFYSLLQGIYDEDEFKEEVLITRQDMATIAYRAANRAHISLPDKTYSTTFYDISSFNYYSVEAISELQEADIIHGTGNNLFSPNDFTTRAEAVKIIHNLYKLKV